MGTQKNAGFTIIELMLFLAVTGALAVGILVGSGVAIGQQRYRDSVMTLKSLIQQQYNEAVNVANNRTGGEACVNAIVVAPPSPVASPQPRGTTDCLLLGRSISISTDGSEVTTANVVAYRTSDTAPVEATDNLELTRNYRLAVSPIDKDTQSIAWSARVVKPRTSMPQVLSMLIIRSPLSGSLMTFVSESTQPNLNLLVAAGPNTVTTDLCVEPSSGSFGGQQLAVRINRHATSQSAIEVPLETDGVCT